MPPYQVQPCYGHAPVARQPKVTASLRHTGLVRAIDTYTYSVYIVYVCVIVYVCFMSGR